MSKGPHILERELSCVSAKRKFAARLLHVKHIAFAHTFFFRVFPCIRWVFVLSAVRFLLRNPLRKTNGLQTERIRNASWKHHIRQFDGRCLLIHQSFNFATIYLDIHNKTISDWGTI